MYQHEERARGINAWTIDFVSTRLALTLTREQLYKAFIENEYSAMEILFDFSQESVSSYRRKAGRLEIWLGGDALSKRLQQARTRCEEEVNRIELLQSVGLYW